MNRLHLKAGLVVLTVLIAWAWSFAAAGAQEQLVVEGRVTNGTQGESSVAGLVVVLHQDTLAGHQGSETITDGAGNFRFDGIVPDPNVAYGVSVNYQGALYGTDLDLSTGSPPPVTLTVYDASENADLVATALESVLFTSADKSTQTVSALEIVRIVNDSNQTYVPGPEPMNLLRFGLPQGAQGLQVDTSLLGADFAQVDLGFALLASVPPGEHEVMFAYRFPYSGDSATFTKSLVYGAENLRILAPEGELNLSSDQIGGAEVVTIGERRYQLLKASGLPRGARVSLELEGLPVQSLGERLSRDFKAVRFEYTAPVALGLLMVSAIGYMVWRRAKEEHRASVAPSEESIVHQERQAVRQMIGDLERGFRAGSVSEDDYRRRRKVLEARLSSLARG